MTAHDGAIIDINVRAVKTLLSSTRVHDLGVTNTSSDDQGKSSVSKGLAILRANLKRLMAATNASPKVLAQACGVNLKTVQRLLSDESGHEPRMDIVSNLATYFELEVWQLLVPDLHPTNRPMLAREVETVRKLLDNINTSREALEGILREQGNTRPGDL